MTITDHSLAEALEQALAETPTWSEAAARRAADADRPDLLPTAPAAPCRPSGLQPQPDAGESWVGVADLNAPSDTEWVDLAANRAGAEARAHAVAAREAAPVLTFAARMLGVHTNERAWRIGADGEEKVAAKLDRLTQKDSRWRVLHAVPVGSRGSDIDHVVVGPGGVYTLNSKHHPGATIWVRGDRFLVNGRSHPYVRNSRFEAERASTFLTAAVGRPVFVTGVVVPVRAESVTISASPADVWVVTRRDIHRWLQRRPTALGEAEVDAVYEAARRSTTWQQA